MLFVHIFFASPVNLLRDSVPLFASCRPRPQFINRLSVVCLSGVFLQAFVLGYDFNLFTMMKPLYVHGGCEYTCSDVANIDICIYNLYLDFYQKWEWLIEMVYVLLWSILCCKYQYSQSSDQGCLDSNTSWSLGSVLHYIQITNRYNNKVTSFNFNWSNLNLLWGLFAYSLVYNTWNAAQSDWDQVIDTASQWYSISLPCKTLCLYV